MTSPTEMSPLFCGYISDSNSKTCGTLICKCEVADEGYSRGVGGVALVLLSLGHTPDWLRTSLENQTRTNTLIVHLDKH